MASRLKRARPGAFLGVGSPDTAVARAPPTHLGGPLGFEVAYRAGVSTRVSPLNGNYDTGERGVSVLCFWDIEKTGVSLARACVALLMPHVYYYE